ncbi:hypothetical protein ACFXGA_30225 [Actinosynnema sp. NPDC059335]|uniref:hypothetical protein n=1 Tax=Actinosynnema sp. NPDC059335 TaxID=3346804 RepID=UPI00366A7957
MAGWGAWGASVQARLADIDWIAPALAAMDRGEPLPPPFDDDRRLWDRLLADERVPHTLVTTPDGRHDDFLQQAMALPAIFTTRERDPLRAALDAVWTAVGAFGRGRHGLLFAELRRAFPVLA